jgi:drug/metabolite transporter (DMT)-like permease
MDIGKAILLSTSSYPAISLLFAFLFLHEIPTVYQWTGFFVILTGILLITVRKKSEKVPTSI